MEKILLKNNLKECQSGYDMMELYNATNKDDIESIGSDHDDDELTSESKAVLNINTPGSSIIQTQINIPQGTPTQGRIINLNNFSATSLITPGINHSRFTLNTNNTLTPNNIFRTPTTLNISRMDLHSLTRGRSRSDMLDDDMDDDLNLHAGPGGVFSSTGRYQLEKEKRIRREIANSNERRRMQSINAGFNTLRNLIPTRHKEKMSKASILQQTADYIRFLEEEKNILIKRNNQLEAFIKLNSNLGATSAGAGIVLGNNSNTLNANVNIQAAAHILANQQGLSHIKVVNAPVNQMLKSPITLTNTANNSIGQQLSPGGSLRIMVSGNSVSALNSLKAAGLVISPNSGYNQQSGFQNQQAASNIMAQQFNSAKRRKLNEVTIKEEAFDEDDDSHIVASQTNLNALGPVLKNFAPILPSSNNDNEVKKIENNSTEFKSVNVKSVSEVLSLFKANTSSSNDLMSNTGNVTPGIKIIPAKGTNINLQKLGIFKTATNILVPKIQLLNNSSPGNEEGRRNLQTIVEAIKHLEGDNLFPSNSNNMGGLVGQNNSSSSSSNHESLQSPLGSNLANLPLSGLTNSSQLNFNSSKIVIDHASGDIYITTANNIKMGDGDNMNVQSYEETDTLLVSESAKLDGSVLIDTSKFMNSDVSLEQSSVMTEAARRSLNMIVNNNICSSNLDLDSIVQNTLNSMVDDKDDLDPDQRRQIGQDEVNAMLHTHIPHSHSNGILNSQEDIGTDDNISDASAFIFP